jgi:hypothetical protein
VHLAIVGFENVCTAVLRIIFVGGAGGSLRYYVHKMRAEALELNLGEMTLL